MPSFLVTRHGQLRLKLLRLMKIKRKRRQGRGVFLGALQSIRSEIFFSIYFLFFVVSLHIFWGLMKYLVKRIEMIDIWLLF